MITKEEGFTNERYISFPIKLHCEDVHHPLLQDSFPIELGFYPEALYHYKERHEGLTENILLYCVKGSGYVEVNEQQIQLTEQTAFCLPAHRSHRYFADNTNPWSLFWIHFSLADSTLFPFESVVAVESSERHRLIEHHFSELFSLCEKEYNFGNALCASKLLQLLLSEIYYLQDHQVTDQQNVLLEKSIRFLSLHLQDSLSLADIAEHLGISTSYVSLIFNKYHQQGPIDFLLDLRVEQACKLLRTRGLKTYEVAKEVGYDDPYYFSRMFKKKVGVSPKDFKNSLQN